MDYVMSDLMKVCGSCSLLAKLSFRIKSLTSQLHVTVSQMYPMPVLAFFVLTDL